MPDTSPRLGKSEMTLAKHKEGAVNAPPRYAKAREVPVETTMHLTLEGQQQKEHDAQKSMMPKRAWGPPRLRGETSPIILGTAGLGLRLRGMN
jgi:hypothetical protein